MPSSIFGRTITPAGSPRHRPRGKTTCQVDRFWLEVRDGRSVKELVADWDQSWAGIGVIRV